MHLVHFFLFFLDHGSAWYQSIFSGGIIMQPGHYLAQAPQHLTAWGTVGKDHIWKILPWLQTITQLSFEAATCMRIGKAWALCDCLNVNLLFASENISITGNILLFRNWKFSKLAKWKNNKILRIFCKCQSCHFRYLVQGARSLITISDPAPLWPSVMNVWHVHSFVATQRNIRIWTFNEIVLFWV